VDTDHEKDLGGCGDEEHKDTDNKTGVFPLSQLQDACRLWVVELGGAHVMYIIWIVCGRMSRIYR
jgi:hypothetical protein